MNSIVQSLGGMQLSDTYMLLQIGEEKKKFYYIWLRDNCRCKDCYSTFFSQIVNLIIDVPLNIKPNSCEIIDKKLIVLWEDGHRSEYLLTWLDSIEFDYTPKIKSHLWDHNVVKNVDDITVPVEDYFKDLNGVKALAGNILKFGFGIVSGVEPTIEATEKVINHFSYIQKTFFGELWYIQPNSDCNDTSSTNIALFPHNDNTYFTNPAGLQIFHLIKHDGEGGSTVLVDGFFIANIIKNKSPQAYDTLCTVPVEAQFIDKKHHYICTAPILQLHPLTKELHQVRFNIYDRSPFTTLKDDNILKFYEALTLFGKEVNNVKNQYLFKLQPGTVVFIDNWRVLHGRTEYTGNREIAGCYISRDDFVSSTKRLYPEIHY